MSVAELKEEAIRQFAVKMESVEDERTLIMVLDFLGGIKNGDASGINLSRHYGSIKAKYADVLKRLAV
jgi:hypothetical protein